MRNVGRNYAEIQFSNITSFFCRIVFWTFRKILIFNFSALLVILVAVFIYAMRDIKGLKYNQDKQFIVISIVLYLIALLPSLIYMIVFILFVGYEVSNERSLKIITHRVLPFFIITLFVLCQKLFLN
jgi:hypothetical protein